MSILAKDHSYDFSRIQEAKGPHIENGTLSFVIFKKHGAVVTDTPFFNQLTEGIDQACRQAHYSLNINYLYADDNLSHQVNSLSYCNGMILLVTEMNYFDCVLINNFQGAYQATEFIIHKTKSQPGYLRSSYPIGNFLERTDGFYKAIRENGMSPSKSQVLLLSPSTEGAYKDMLELLKSGEDVSRCYFADNDLIAIEAMKAMKEMGQMAVSRLIQIMTSPENPPVKIEIGTKIINRKSVC